MGWCSGTDIFDPVVKHCLNSDMTDEQKKGVIKALIPALWDGDWDCESDSDYWEHPLVQAVWKELDPEGYQLYQDDKKWMEDQAELD